MSQAFCCNQENTQETTAVNTNTGNDQVSNTYDTLDPPGEEVDTTMDRFQFTMNRQPKHTLT